MHDLPRGFDLNLLALFDALVQTRQVTAAAARVGISQPAASHALRRLRDSVGDRLFVRGPGGLLFTPRGEALARGVRSALVTLGHALAEHVEFDPRQSTRAFRITARDAFDIMILPKLLPRLSDAAPGISLALASPGDRDIGEDLASGASDLYFGVLPNMPAFEGLLPEVAGGALRTLPIYEEGWVCVVRSGHPRIRRKPTLRQYASEQHILLSPTGAGPGILDRMLEAEGLSRKILLRVASFYSALDCVRSTDCLWTAPKHIAATLDRGSELRHLPLPLAPPPYLTRIVWHERFDQDPAHRWLRQLIVEVGRVRKRG